jgi:hypothetical protein
VPRRDMSDVSRVSRCSRGRPCEGQEGDCARACSSAAERARHAGTVGSALLGIPRARLSSCFCSGTDSPAPRRGVARHAGALSEAFSNPPQPCLVNWAGAAQQPSPSLTLALPAVCLFRSSSVQRLVLDCSRPASSLLPPVSCLGIACHQP